MKREPYYQNNPHDLPQWSEHLEWLLETHPQRVRELHQQGKLKEYLDRKVSLAARKISELMESKNLSYAEASEIASQSLLSPPDGPATKDKAPEPLPQEDLDAILKWAEQKFPDVQVAV
jgi:hypothetical protein